MKIGEACNRDVVVIDHSESAYEAANLMRENHVGDVVVVRYENGVRIPIGIVTDRDLVLEIIVPQVDPRNVEAGELFTRTHLETVTIEDDLEQALDIMHAQGIRRLPVIDKQDGALVGIITIDDIVDLLSEQLSEIGRLHVTQQNRERLTR